MTQFAWDFENRLTQVVSPSSGSVTYKYDGLGRRIQRTPSNGISTNFIYDSQDVVKDINSDGTTIEYLNGPGIDNPVGMLKVRDAESGTTLFWYHSDPDAIPIRIEEQDANHRVVVFERVPK